MNLKRALLSIVCITNIAWAHAYSITINSKVDTNKVALIDVGDVAHHVFNKHHVVDTSKAKVGEPLFSILPGFGYSQLTGFTVLVDNNVSFYTTASKTANISTIKFTPEYSQHKQFTPILTTSIWSKNNAYNIVSDWRYYNYNVKDFGLGSATSEQLYNTYSYDFIRLHQTVLKNIFPDFLVGAGYNFDYHFNIKNTNLLLPLVDNNHKKTNNTVSSGLTTNLLYDTRRNENSPVANGWYVSLCNTHNSKFLKSSHNYTSIYLDTRHYIGFPRKSGNILAVWNLNWFTLGRNVPYFDMPSTLWDTYDNAGRTFIQGRFRGRNMMYLETEYRFKLLKNELLGGAVFTNAQSFSSNISNDFNTLLLGYGASLRVKVNKKSNVYFVLSYGAGKGGAQGFFFNLGEVF
jgi:hypothetical protein